MLKQWRERNLDPKMQRSNTTGLRLRLGLAIQIIINDGVDRGQWYSDAPGLVGNLF